METKSYYKTVEEIREGTYPISYSILEGLDIDKISGVSWQTENGVLSSITIIFEKEDPELTKVIKDSILDELGTNHTNTIQFIKVTNHDEPYGLYTYRNDVYVLKDSYDVPFDSLKLSEQIKISNMFEAKEWKINKTLQ